MLGLCQQSKRLGATFAGDCDGMRVEDEDAAWVGLGLLLQMCGSESEIDRRPAAPRTAKVHHK